VKGTPQPLSKFDFWHILQESITSDWKRKCDLQLQLLGVCQAYRVFEMIPSKQATDIKCPFTISNPYDELKYYITPGCLIYIKKPSNEKQDGLTGAFFNPCMGTKGCYDNPSFNILEIENDLLTHVTFDVRNTGSVDALGHWPIEFSTGNEDANTRLQKARDTLEQWYIDGKTDVPWRLSSQFVNQIVMNGGRNAPGVVGNPKAGTTNTWANTEGFAKDNTEFCDGIADWWPEVRVLLMFY
jgi:hypothetical protein